MSTSAERDLLASPQRGERNEERKAMKRESSAKSGDGDQESDSEKFLASERLGGGELAALGDHTCRFLTNQAEWSVLAVCVESTIRAERRRLIGAAVARFRGGEAVFVPTNYVVAVRDWLEDFGLPADVARRDVRAPETPRAWSEDPVGDMLACVKAGEVEIGDEVPLSDEELFLAEHERQYPPETQAVVIEMRKRSGRVIALERLRAAGVA